MKRSESLDADESKSVWYEGQQRRDELILARLREEGFAFCELTGDSDPETDFLIYLNGLGGLQNVVVGAPEHTIGQVANFYAVLPSLRFHDGTKIEVLNSFFPDPNSWFRSQPEIVFFKGGEFVSAVTGVNDSDRAWAHSASLRIIRNGTESRLRVVHVGLGRDAIFASLFAPRSLVPRRIIYEW